MKTLTIGAFTLVAVLAITLVDFNTSTLSKESTNIKEVTLNVNGMTCRMCPLTIKTALKRLNGVVDANVSYENKEAKVRYEEGKVTVDEMIKAIENAGNYRAALLDRERDIDRERDKAGMCM
jgi:Copper chaperone